MMAGEATASLSAFLLGNTFRLREHRKRTSRIVRIEDGDPAILARLPSDETVRGRIGSASAGALLGKVASFWATLLVENASDEARVLIIVGTVVALLCGVGGTFSRPLD
jgi:hypothetical protein